MRAPFSLAPLSRAAAAALALVLCANASACKLLREPTPLEGLGERVVVHAMLEAGSERVGVRMRRVRAPAFLGDSASRPLSGAAVRIARGGATVALPEDAAGFAPCAPSTAQTEPPATAGAGCYAASLPGGVVPGEPHELRIDLPAGGGTVRGTAVAPAPARVLSPAAGARLGVPGTSSPGGGAVLPVRWEAGAGVAGIAISLLAREVFEGGKAVPGATCFADLSGPGAQGGLLDARAADSATLRVEGLFCGISGNSPAEPGRPVAADSVRAVLRVLAFDTAYTRYAEVFENKSARPEAATAGLSGALGVFGGVAETRVPVVLVVGSQPGASRASRRGW